MQSTAVSPALDYNERNALRYVTGYATRHPYTQLYKSTHPMKEELLMPV